ncbi:MBL fold metallo-hydrolase [Comamonas flocculans]|uniref:3',5'-cyclic-nucleotide phosphodiesterase n=1 Tax=Comamonas flocculans TaxID=2597701 RepID=A0A5B8RWB6_9BURK|nr:3',5'-cyclic-nucleotide phosphodiesterase [Comamonas flocculans]QEA12994.1 3',5'-cyclic-nucleotide phosphodiesterase [Comamonas flocculans]
MKVSVLGCSGSIARGCRTTAFLLGEHVLVDAGTGVGELSVAQMRAVSHVFLSHSHLDHIAALPLLLDTVGSRRAAPLQVFALPQTIEALRRHVFNDVIWPDFTRIPSTRAPMVQLHPIGVGDVLVAAGITLEVLAARHSVPAVGYAARGQGAWWVFSGDTEGQEPAFWQRVNALQAEAPGVGALVIETAFSDREQVLARKSAHLSPSSLAQELAQLQPRGRFPIYLSHFKPSEGASILAEVRALEADGALQIIDLQTVDELRL